jgi:hypothetical protein
MVRSGKLQARTLAVLPRARLLRDADVLRCFAPVLLFVLEPLFRLSSKLNAQTLFFALKGLPEPVRRISSVKRVADTPKTSAVSLTVGNGPVIVAFIQTSSLHIVSLTP